MTHLRHLLAAAAVAALAPAVNAAPAFSASARALAAADAPAVTVTAPGTLASAVTDTEATALTVSGPVDAADLFWISKAMPQLTDLNLRDAVISAYSGAMLHGRTNYPGAYLPEGVFAGTGLKTVALPAQEGLSIGTSAFASTPLEALTIGTNVAVIGDGAFSYCTALTKLNIPTSVAVGAYAFSNCTALEAVTLDGATAIPAGAFAGCLALKEVKGTAKVAVIGAHAFADCPALTAFAFPAALTAIGQCAFEGSGLKEADMTACKALATVGAWAFAKDGALTAVYFTPNAEGLTLGSGVFFDCPALKEVKFPEALAVLPDYALKGATATAVAAALPASLDSIGDYALKDNTAVAVMTLPAALTAIGDGAMEGMTGLQEIDATALAAPAALGSDVWAGVDQPNVTLKADAKVADDFRAADQWREFAIQSVTGVDNVTGADGSSGVSGRFEGYDLVVSATGSPIRAVTLYDAKGIQLAEVAGRGQTAVTIATDAFASPLFIVRATLEDGTVATAKLMRTK